MVKFFTGNNPSPYVSDAYKGKLPLGRVRAEMEKRGLAWTPEIEAKLFRVAGDLVFDDTLPEEPLIDADPAGAFAAGVSAGAVGNQPAGSFAEDPLARTSHLAGLLLGAGKATGLVRAAAPKIPAIAASALGMGGYSGVETAGSGAPIGEVAKATGIGALTGGALHGVNMLPGAMSLPGQAAVFGGMEALGGGSLQDVLAAAALGPLAGKAVGGFPGRRIPGEQELPVMPPGSATTKAALPGGSVLPPLMLPEAGGPVPLLQRGQGESAIRLPGDISPVGEARMESRPWELVPVPDKVQEPLPRPDVTPEGNAARRRRVQEASRPTRPVLAKPDQPDYKSISEAVPPADLEAVGIIPPDAGREFSPRYEEYPDASPLPRGAEGGVSYGAAVKKIKAALGETEAVALEIANRIPIVGRRGNGIMLDSAMVERAAGGEFDGFPLAKNRDIASAEAASTSAVNRRAGEIALKMRKGGVRHLPTQRLYTVQRNAAPDYVDAMVLRSGSPGNMRRYEPGARPEEIVRKSVDDEFDILGDTYSSKAKNDAVARPAGPEQREAYPKTAAQRGVLTASPERMNRLSPPQAEQPLTRAQRREAISKVMRRPRPLDLQKAAVEDAFAKAGYEPVGDDFGAASEAASSAAGLVRSRRSTVANRSDIVAPESPVANDLPDQGPITQPKPRVRLRRSSGVMAGSPKSETAASTDYEHLGGIDYRNRKTGQIVTKIGEDYVPATPEYAARVQQKSAGLSRQKATGEPVIKDVTLGSGLGGAQGAIKGPKFDAPAREVSSGNGVDIGAERYRKSGDIADWARSTATLKVSDKFTKEIAGLKDVRPGEYSFGGRKYALQGFGGGKLGSAVERDILWPNLNAELARDDFMNTWKLRARSVVEKHKIKGRDGDLFVRGQDPAHAQDADVKAVHALLREIRSEHNTAMAAIGGKQMGDVGENYIPRIKKSGMLDRILERQVDESVGNEFSMLHATEKANARAMHRTGRDGEYETDVRVLMDRYIESAAKAIFNNPVIQQNRLHADALEAAGLKGGAELVRNYTDVVWADKPTKLDREMNDWPRWARVAFRSAPAENKHLLNKAVFTMNLAFNLGVQPASVVNTVARYGFRNSTKGLFLSMNPEFRRWTWENTRSGRAKREAGENLVAEGEARGLSVGDSSKPPSLGDKAERWATWTTSVVERAASAHGAASAYYDGKARGFTGRKLREWMNDGISKTQEDYFRAGLPGNLQNRAAPGWVGFYTYFNGMLNMGRELSGISKTGHYAEYAGKTKAETVAKRMRYAVRFVVAAALYDELSHAITGRRPYREVVTGNFEGVMPGGAGLIPYSHAEGLQQAMAQSLRYDTGEPLIKWATSRYAKGGVFFNRMWQTAKAEEDNLTVRDVRGNRKYQYEEDERWKAWLFGTGSTRDGSEYNARYMKGDVYKALEAETNDEPRRDRKPGKPSGPPKPRRP